MGDRRATTDRHTIITTHSARVRPSRLEGESEEERLRQPAGKKPKGGKGGAPGQSAGRVVRKGGKGRGGERKELGT